MMYEQNVANLKIEIARLEVKIENMVKKKAGLTEELKELESFRNIVNGEETGIGDLGLGISDSNPQSLTPNPQSPILENEGLQRADTLGIDPAGYSNDFTLEEKIGFILKNAPEPLKIVVIAAALRGFDKSFGYRNNHDLLTVLSPKLSRMKQKGALVAGYDGKQGSCYIHSSWIEAGKIKPEFADRCKKIIRMEL